MCVRFLKFHCEVELMITDPANNFVTIGAHVEKLIPPKHELCVCLLVAKFHITEAPLHFLVSLILLSVFGANGTAIESKPSSE
jgi:hypothetical protein